MFALLTACAPEAPLTRALRCAAVPPSRLSATYGAAVEADAGGGSAIRFGSHPHARGAVVLSAAPGADPFAPPPTAPLGETHLRLRFTVVPQLGAPLSEVEVGPYPAVRGLVIAFITAAEGAGSLGGPGGHLGLMAYERWPGSVNVPGFALELDFAADLGPTLGLRPEQVEDIEPAHPHAALVVDGAVADPLLISEAGAEALEARHGTVELELDGAGRFVLRTGATAGEELTELLRGEVPAPMGTAGRWTIIGVVTDPREDLWVDTIEICTPAAP
jgi:hypothetical protein